MLAFLLAAVLSLTIHDGLLRVAVVGDVGDGSAAVANGIAKVHASMPLDAVILTGDNIYPCGVKTANDPKWSVLRPLSDLHLPLYPVLGNHDYCGNAAAQIDAPLPYWRFPAPSYALETEVASFVFLDTTPIAKGKAPPAAPQFANAPWRIAVGHHPIVSSGYHGYLPRDEHNRMKALLPLLREAKTDLYISGHDHHLELLRGSPLMLVSGAGSSPVVPVLRHGSTMFPPHTAKYRGFAVVELRASEMRIRFFDADAKAQSGWYAFPR